MQSEPLALHAQLCNDPLQNWCQVKRGLTHKTYKRIAYTSRHATSSREGS